MEYRRRLSRGLLVNASYTYSRKLESSLQTIHQPRFFLVDDERSVPHVWKLNWIYELPFGQGRRFGSSLEPGRERDSRRLGAVGYRADTDSSVHGRQA